MSFPHVFPGQYTLEGMLLGTMHVRHVVDKVPGFDMEGDLLLATYPKTGTTWMQELIWLLSNNGDISGAKAASLNRRFPHIEFSSSEEGPYQYDVIAEKPHPRLIKTHLPWQFFQKQLQGNTKVIVVVRNPKDTLVSLYHFYRMNVMLGSFTGTWDTFFEMYQAKYMYFGDYFDWYLGWWNKEKDNPNVLFVTYEDMKKDLPKVAKNVGSFIGKSLPDDKFSQVIEYLGFSNMKQNSNASYKDSKILRQDVSPFMRKGIVGDWKNYFSEEQSAAVDERYQNTLLKAGLTLAFE